MSVSSCMLTIPTNYSGSDVGYAVMGIGQSTALALNKYNLPIDSYRFVFRRIGEKHKGWLYYPTYNNLFSNRKTKRYRSSDETGIVEIAALQAGQYELVNFEVFRSHASPFDMLLPDVSGSAQDFSIPFEIKPGKVVYLGNYQANLLSKKGDVFFIVEDRFARDLALAKLHIELLPVENARDAMPDVEKVGNRFLISAAQAKAREAANPGVQP